MAWQNACVMCTIPPDPIPALPAPDEGQGFFSILFNRRAQLLLAGEAMEEEGAPVLPSAQVPPSPLAFVFPRSPLPWAHASGETEWT
jgi:hypothetical protein